MLAVLLFAVAGCATTDAEKDHSLAANLREIARNVSAGEPLAAGVKEMPSPKSKRSLAKYGIQPAAYQASIRDDEPARLPSPKKEQPVPEAITGLSNGESIDFGTALGI